MGMLTTPVVLGEVCATAPSSPQFPTGKSGKHSHWPYCQSLIGTFSRNNVISEWHNETPPGRERIRTENFVEIRYRRFLSRKTVLRYHLVPQNSCLENTWFIEITTSLLYFSTSLHSLPISGHIQWTTFMTTKINFKIVLTSLFLKRDLHLINFLVCRLH